VVVVLTVLGVGLVGLILLSTVLQAQAFEIARLSSKADALTVQEQELRREVERLQAPAALAERAMRLGMVPNANPVFLQPSDGKVIGDPEPAEPRSNVRRVDR
jgi:cell division protein FtsB